MSDSLVNALVSVALAIVGVATISVIVSKNANTTAVISSASQGFSGALSTALSPVTGNTGAGNFSGFGQYNGIG